MNTLFNIYFIFCFLLFGPEAIAKSLPMKKVQTVETVWVPMDESEVENAIQEGEEIRAVELPDQSEGAVPLFKEGVVQEESLDSQTQVVKSEELPDLQIKTPKVETGQQPPIIQVFYQGHGDKKKAIDSKKEKAAQVVKQEEVMPPVEIKEEVKQPILPIPKKKNKDGGDVYNFYFQS